MNHLICLTLIALTPLITSAEYICEATCVDFLDYDYKIRQRPKFRVVVQKKPVSATMNSRRAAWNTLKKICPKKYLLLSDFQVRDELGVGLVLLNPVKAKQRSECRKVGEPSSRGRTGQQRAVPEVENEATAPSDRVSR